MPGDPLVPRRSRHRALSSRLTTWLLPLALGGAFAPQVARAGKAEPASARPKPDSACAYRTPVYLHEVVEGEHLGLIAGRYGVYRRDLVELNPELANPDHIRPGQKIKVCPELPPRLEERFEHEVSEGESLALIAKRYGLEVGELIELQGGRLRDPNNIWVGQKLSIVRDGEIVPGFEPEPEKPRALGRAARLEDGPGYRLRRPHLTYGTPATIDTLKRVLSRYQTRARGGPEVRVGDISKKGGGPLSGHLSHQHGVDVDIGLIHRGPAAKSVRFVRATESNLDVRRTWVLVHEFLRTGKVRYIFLDYAIQKKLYEYAREHGVAKQQLDAWFQYPRGKGRGHGIVRHWRNHADHIHVRFRK